MTLAILICSLPERQDKLKRLLDLLVPQMKRYPNEVTYAVHDAGRSMPTGKKRNELIRNTDSDYFVFIDDDDLVAADYVESIMTALQSQPDVVTFDGFITTNGADRREWTIRLGSKYEERGGKYYRWPNHIVPMKREKVQHIKFPEIWQQEDYQWSKRIHELQLLKTEIHIDKALYHYDCYPVSTRVARRRARA